MAFSTIPARSAFLSERIEVMVWVIVLIWVLIVAAFVVFVLRLAHGESANRAFSQSLNDRVRRASKRQGRRKDELPRISGGRLSFTPEPAETAQKSDESQVKPIQYPVYVNSPSVVEMRALLTSESTDEMELWQTNHGQLVTPYTSDEQGIGGRDSSTGALGSTDGGRDHSGNKVSHTDQGQGKGNETGRVVQTQQGWDEPADTTSDVLPAIGSGQVHGKKRQ